jgi:hypothetical protein
MLGTPHGPQEDGDVFRPILSVCVHHDNSVSRPMLLDVGECDGNGPLMAQIASQRENCDVFDGAGA